MKAHLLAALLTCCFGSSAALATIPLLYQTPEETLGDGFYATDIAVTPDGRPSIAYVDWQNTRLIYAEYKHPYWYKQTVFQTLGGAKYLEVSLSLDSSGNPAIAVKAGFINNWSKVIVYERIGVGFNDWTEVYASEDDTYTPSLDHDVLGNLHLAYRKQLTPSSPTLRYATNLTGSWVVEDIQSFSGSWNGLKNQSVSLVVGPSHRPAVAWNNFNGDLKYSQKNVNWTTETVTGMEVEWVSLAVGSGSVPHISFMDSDDRDLGYAVGPIWDITTFPEANDVGVYSDIALDSLGDPHIAYRDTTAGSLRYKRLAGGTWLDDPIDSAGDVGQHAAIAIDGYDHIHFSYVENTLHELRYAASRDCNDNGLTDNLDIQIGNLIDCDGNGMPDVCEWAYGFLDDCNSNGIPDDCEVDCNNNGIPDDCDISDGTSLDCNLDGIPDECPSEADCDGNGIPDECETPLDCNGNGLPDACDLDSGYSNDCNGNGIPDECDIAAGTVEDCNNNGRPDACDLAAGFGDCNNNGIIDSCDIASGLLKDCDGSGYPDICEAASPGTDCNANGILDSCDLGVGLLAAGTSGQGEFGHALATGGDFNGDGFVDLGVGAASEIAHVGPGRVHVFAGGPGLDDIPEFILQGQNANDEFGAALAFVGDFNGDGEDDLAVGAPGNDSGPTNGGRAYIYFGGPSADGIADVTLVNNSGSFGAALGKTLAAAGDVNGDGFADVLVGSPGSSQSARLHLYLGSDSYGPGSQINPSSSYGSFGGSFVYPASIAGNGDLNGDQYADVVVGAHTSSSGSSGRVQVMLGGPGGLSSGVTLSSAFSDDYFGLSVAFTGDLNSDGRDEVLVGAPFDGRDGFGTGHAYLYYGGAGMDATPDLEFSPPMVPSLSNGHFGISVAGGQDLNNDGLDDLIIGQSAQRNGGTPGRAYVFYGSIADDVQLDRLLVGSLHGDELGRAVAMASDLNGDGVLDFVVGSPSWNATGRADVYDVRAATFADCNENGIGDACDLESGVSFDVNNNGIPDECEAVVSVGDIPTGRFGLSQANPNPFNPTTTLHFDVPAAGHVRLEIFDLRGHRVSTLVDGQLSAGPHSEQWRGESDRGARASSGVYFARLTHTESRKVSMLKLLLAK